MIKSLFKPELELIKLQYSFDENGGSDFGNNNIRKIFASGDSYPRVVINGYEIKETQLEYCRIDYEGFLPRLRLKLNMSGNTDFLDYLPKDYDIASIYISSKIPQLHPIRNDFVILSVDVYNMDNRGFNGMYVIQGELHVPGIKKTRQYANTGTSLDTLKDIAKTLKLGFSTNETQTSDRMNWICANQSFERFIDYVSKKIYKDDNSFYHVFIDPYYNLNVINIRSSIESSPEDNKQLVKSYNEQLTYLTSKTQYEDNAILMPKFISNYGDTDHTTFIKTLKLINDSSNNSNKNGLKTAVQLYDHFLEKPVVYTIDGYIPPETSDEMYIDVLRGSERKENRYNLRNEGNTASEYLDEMTIKRNVGTIYSGQDHNVYNTYIGYERSSIQNNRLIDDIHKLNLEVTLERGNFNIIRGDNLPCLIYVTDHMERIEAMREANSLFFKNDPLNTTADLAPGSKLVIDRFFTGMYYVSSFSLTYDIYANVDDTISPTRYPFMYQTIRLARMHWPKLLI